MGASWRRLGGVLEVLGGVMEGLEGVLECLGGVLEASWAVLGRLGILLSQSGAGGTSTPDTAVAVLGGYLIAQIQ